MHLSDDDKNKLQTEIIFSASRSSGPGGQNVNKVNTKVELRFSVSGSSVLTDNQKQIILSKLKNRINVENEIVLVSGSERSQLRNKKKVAERFLTLLEKALTPVKRRLKTNPTLNSRLKRLETKKINAQKKQTRKPPEL